MNLGSRSAINFQGSRRRFAATATAWLAALPALSATAVAQTPPSQSTTKQAPAPPAPQPAQAPQTPSPAAEAYGEVIRARYGDDRVSADDLARIKRDIEGNLRSVERLRAYKLKNGDEPDFIFSA